METSVIRTVLSDGSDVFDVVFVDGSSVVKIAADSEAAAYELQEAIRKLAAYATID